MYTGNTAQLLRASFFSPKESCSASVYPHSLWELVRLIMELVGGELHRAKCMKLIMYVMSSLDNEFKLIILFSFVPFKVFFLFYFQIPRRTP